MREVLNVFMALGEYSHEEPVKQLRQYRRSWLLLSLYALAKSTPDCHVTLMYCGLDNDFLAMCASVTARGRNFRLTPEFIGEGRASDITNGKEGGVNLGTHANLRLFIHRLHPEIDEYVWLDCDTVPLEDMHGFLEAGRNALKSGSGRNHFACVGDSFFGKPGANSGVMYCDAAGLRNDSEACGRIDRLCGIKAEDGSSITKGGGDQDIVNTVGFEFVPDTSWNVCFPDVPEEPLADARLIHLTVAPKYAMGPVSRMPGWGFLRKMAEGMTRLCPHLAAGGRRYLFTTTGDLNNSERRDAHVFGRPGEDRFLQSADEYVPGYFPNAVDIACYISGGALARALETSMVSYVSNCSVPVRFHIMLTPGTCSEDEVWRLLKFSSALQDRYGCTVEVRNTPDRILYQTVAAGDQLDSAVWKNNLSGDLMHDVFRDVDLCVRVDADTVCVGDIAWLVGYCMGFGLGENRHLFGLPNRWMHQYPERMAFGVSPQSFSMMRESGFTDFLFKRMAYGRFLRADGEYSLAIQAGILKAGSYPMEWNMHTDLRRPLSSLSFTEFQDIDAVYGNIPGARTVPSPKYLKPMVYHFTGPPKPWEGTSFNQEVWDRYTRLAEAVSRSAE